MANDNREWFGTEDPRMMAQPAYADGHAFHAEPNRASAMNIASAGYYLAYEYPLVDAFPVATGSAQATHREIDAPLYAAPYQMANSNFHPQPAGLPLYSNSFSAATIDTSYTHAGDSDGYQFFHGETQEKISTTYAWLSGANGLDPTYAQAPSGSYNTPDHLRYRLQYRHMQSTLCPNTTCSLNPSGRSTGIAHVRASWSAVPSGKNTAGCVAGRKSSAR